MPWTGSGVMFNCGGARGSASWPHSCPSSCPWMAPGQSNKACSLTDQPLGGSLRGPRGRAEAPGGWAGLGVTWGRLKASSGVCVGEWTLAKGHGWARAGQPGTSSPRPFTLVAIPSGCCWGAPPRLCRQSKGVPECLCETPPHALWYQGWWSCVGPCDIPTTLLGSLGPFWEPSCLVHGGDSFTACWTDGKRGKNE